MREARAPRGLRVYRQELVQLVHGFIGRYPDLYDWFKRFVGYKDQLSGMAHAP